MRALAPAARPKDGGGVTGRQDENARDKAGKKVKMRYFSKDNKGLRPGERGISLILVTALLFVLFTFFVLAVDLAYIYYVRGQLQNAADAGALAGAGKLLPEVGPDGQGDAKEEARKFAEENFAGGEHVVIQCDPPPCENGGSNTEGPDNDITVGFWDEVNGTYSPGDTTKPTNAIKVVARRTEGASGREKGRFGLFFGRLLDRDVLAVSTLAIAQKPTAAEVPFAICLDTCSATIPPGGLTLYWASATTPTHPPERIIAWSTLQAGQQTSSSSRVRDFICGLESVDACGERVATTRGLMSSALKELRCAFKDPTYDAENKTIQGGSVVDWTVIVPVLDRCPPSAQGDPDPYDVIDWGQIKITEVYTQSSSASCNGCCRTCPDYGPLPVDFEDESPTTQITGAIRISELRCEDCETASFFARRGRLVK